MQGLVLQLGFGLLPRGDVAGDARRADDGARAVEHRGDGQRHVDDRPVLPAPHHFHADGRCALVEAAQELTDLVGLHRGHEQRKGLADDFLGAVAVDRLGTAVPRRDDAGQRHAHDGVVGGGDDGRHLRLGFLDLATAFGLAEGALDGALLADVAKDRGVHGLAVDHGVGDGRLGGELGAVGPPAPHLGPLSHAPGGNPGVRELLQVVAVTVGNGARKEPIERLAEHLGRRVAEDLLGAAVEQPDAVMAIHADDGVGCDLDDGGQSRIRLPRVRTCGVVLRLVLVHGGRIPVVGRAVARERALRGPPAS